MERTSLKSLWRIRSFKIWPFWYL